jgi:hypothetical protein
MKKTLLQEVKDMNRIAGTQMTVEQEIAFIKNRLQELDFTHQASFDAYRKNHKMRPDTKVKISGKETTVADASKEKSLLQKLGAKLFGKAEEPVSMPKPLDSKNPLNKSKIFDPKRGSSITIGKALENPDRYKHLAADIQSMIDVDPTGEKYKTSQDTEKARDARRKERDKKRQDIDARVTNDRTDKETKPTDSTTKKKDTKPSGSSMFKGFGNSDSANDDNSFDSIIKRMKRRERDDDKDSGFGGFGGGSFGGGGASGDW